MREKPTEPGREKVPSGTSSPPTFPGGHRRMTPQGRTGRPLLPGRRSQRHASHLPCTSCRCPAAARRWGRRTCRKAPAGTAGRGGSSPRCPPHTACGLGETGQGERKFRNRAPTSHALGGPVCPSAQSPSSRGIGGHHGTPSHLPADPTTPGHQPRQLLPFLPASLTAQVWATSRPQSSTRGPRLPQGPTKDTSSREATLSLPWQDLRTCLYGHGGDPWNRPYTSPAGGPQPGRFPAHPCTLHVSLCSSKHPLFPH